MDDDSISSEFIVIAILLVVSYAFTLFIFQTIMLWQMIAYPLVAIFVLMRITQILNRIANALED